MKRNIYFGFILRLKSKPIKSSWKTQTCSSQIIGQWLRMCYWVFGKEKVLKDWWWWIRHLSVQPRKNLQGKSKPEDRRAVRMAAQRQKQLPSFSFDFSWRQNHLKTGLLVGSGGSGNAALERGQGISLAQWMKQITSSWILMADEMSIEVFIEHLGSAALWKKWVLVAQLCLTLCDPMDCSPPGSSVHGIGILQARTLE